MTYTPLECSNVSNNEYCMSQDWAPLSKSDALTSSRTHHSTRGDSDSEHFFQHRHHRRQAEDPKTSRKRCDDVSPAGCIRPCLSPLLWSDDQPIYGKLWEYWLLLRQYFMINESNSNLGFIWVYCSPHMEMPWWSMTSVLPSTLKIYWGTWPTWGPGGGAGNCGAASLWWYIS